MRELAGMQDIIPNEPPADCWLGLSRDVIERFLEVASLERHVSRERRWAYRVDLCALESWLRSTTGHTLVTASTAELWSYFRKAIGAGLDPRLLDRLLASIQHFYAHAREAGFRDDDPASGMPLWMHRNPPAGGNSACHAQVHAHG
jgi:site-specific recombinase XerD